MKRTTYFNPTSAVESSDSENEAPYSPGIDDEDFLFDHISATKESSLKNLKPGAVRPRELIEKSKTGGKTAIHFDYSDMPPLAEDSDDSDDEYGHYSQDSIFKKPALKKVFLNDLTDKQGIVDPDDEDNDDSGNSSDDFIESDIKLPKNNVKNVLQTDRKIPSQLEYGEHTYHLQNTIGPKDNKITAYYRCHQHRATKSRPPCLGRATFSYCVTTGTSKITVTKSHTCACVGQKDHGQTSKASRITLNNFH